MLPLTLKHSNKTVTVDALLNSGSDNNITSQNVAQYLGLQDEEKHLEIKGTLSKTVNVNIETVSLEIVIDNGNSNININTYIASHLDVPPVKYDANEIKNQYQHLRNIPFCDINGDNVGLLIGTNNADLLIHPDYRIGDPGDPISSLEKRFSKNPESLNMCRTQINNYIISGQVSLLSPEKQNKFYH